MNDRRPCPLCNGTGQLEGPIHRPPPRTSPAMITKTKRIPRPPITHEPIGPYDKTLERLRRLSEPLN